MEDLKLIELNGSELKNLPLFFRKIYHNQVSNIEEEKKMIRLNKNIQGEIMCHQFSKREISKTINHQLFFKNEK